MILTLLKLNIISDRCWLKISLCLKAQGALLGLHIFSVSRHIRHFMSVFRFVRKENTMNSKWKHVVCVDAQLLCNLYLFMNSVSLYYLCILIREESRGISTAGVPYSLLLTFSKALSTNTGWNSISLPSQWGTACGKISDLKNWLLLTEFKAADTTIKDDSFGSC